MYLKSLDNRLETCIAGNLDEFSSAHMKASFKKRTEQWHTVGKKCVMDLFGFTIQRALSKIPEAGTGVIVTEGRVPANHLVAFYPGISVEWMPIIDIYTHIYMCVYIYDANTCM